MACARSFHLQNKPKVASKHYSMTKVKKLIRFYNIKKCIATTKNNLDDKIGYSY
jgi:4-hydroxy-L-threonine phosphate dehydrogenase PdxA